MYNKTATAAYLHQHISALEAGDARARTKLQDFCLEELTVQTSFAEQAQLAKDMIADQIRMNEASESIQLARSYCARLGAVPRVVFGYEPATCAVLFFLAETTYRGVPDHDFVVIEARGADAIGLLAGRMAMRKSIAELLVHRIADVAEQAWAGSRDFT